MTSMYGISAFQQIDRSWEAKSMGTERIGAAASARADHRAFSRETKYGISYCSSASLYPSPYDRDYEDMHTGESWQMRRLIRSLTQTRNPDRNPYEVSSDGEAGNLMGISAASESDKADKELSKLKYNYSYKEVAGKIQRAKTSVSAKQAVISAKRKVLEVKRQIASGGGDAEELQLALTHAKRMEMAARKKEHNLELEELVVTTQNRDKRLDEQEEAVEDMRNAVITAAEEKLYNAEDEIFEERQDLIGDFTEEVKESGEEISDEAMAELNEMISKLGEEELKELEEAMEQLENMEIVNPHMSKEDLEELKRKHRAAEQKAIMKADMDYLKGMIRLQTEKGADMKALSGNTSSGEQMAGPAAAAAFTGADFSVASISTPCEPSVDIQV